MMLDWLHLYLVLGTAHLAFLVGFKWGYEVFGKWRSTMGNATAKWTLNWFSISMIIASGFAIARAVLTNG